MTNDVTAMIKVMTSVWSLTRPACLLLLLFPALTRGCDPPGPRPLVEVDETEAGQPLFVMTSSVNATWTVGVVSPSTLATYLQGFLAVEQNASNPWQWNVVLTQALDLERIHNTTNEVVTVITLRIVCKESTPPPQRTERFENFVYVSPVSEFVPRLETDSEELNISEAAYPGTVVTDLMAHVTDDDVSLDEGRVGDIETFRLNPYSGQGVDGLGVFTVTPTGKVTLSRRVDYENPANRDFTLNVTVQDKGGLQSWSPVSVKVTNANDNAPTFLLPGCQTPCTSVTEYRATVNANVTGPVTALHPGPITAVDLDGDPLTYTILSGSPADYNTYVSIDPHDASVTLKQELTPGTLSHLTLVIQVSDEDQDGSRPGTTSNAAFHATTTSLLIFVSGRQIRFPAAPTPRDTSISASLNNDALFISTVVLSILLLLLVVILVVLACRLRKRKQLPGSPTAGRRGAASNRKLGDDWGVRMRPINQDSERAFMRSLSGVATSGPGFDNEVYECDDVFTTDVTPYAIPPGPARVSMATAQGLVPYQEALTHFTSSAGPSGHGEGHQGRVVSPGPSPDGRSPSGQPSADDGLASLYQTLDVLTGVTPFQGKMADLRPAPPSFSDSKIQSDGLADPTAQRQSENQGTRGDKEEATSFQPGDSASGKDPGLDAQLMPLNEFYFEGPAHLSLGHEQNAGQTEQRSDAGQTERSSRNPFREIPESSSNTNVNPLKKAACKVNPTDKDNLDPQQSGFDVHNGSSADDDVLVHLSDLQIAS